MSAKTKTPKLDEFSGSYMPPIPAQSLEPSKPYLPRLSIEKQIERDLALSVSWTVAGREQQGMKTRRGDILDNDRLMPADIENALKLGMVFESEGFFSTLPEWARIDPNCPTTVDFSLPDPTCDLPQVGQVGAESLNEPVNVAPAHLLSESVKPHHVHAKRKADGCRLCAAGVDHIRYLGVSRRTGYRLWVGSAQLIDAAKLNANYKGLFARCRPNGGNGFALLTVEDDRRLDGTDPFADIDFDELINS